MQRMGDRRAAHVQEISAETTAKRKTETGLQELHCQEESLG